MKDLYDMLVMAERLDIPASTELADAVAHTFGLRDTAVPSELPDPPPAWAGPWQAYVREYGIPWSDLTEAIVDLRAFWAAVTSPTSHPLRWDAVTWSWDES